jgi:ribonuclease R
MTIPSDDEILGFFEAHPQPLHPKALGRALGFPNIDVSELKKALYRLAREERLIQDGKERFGLIEDIEPQQNPKPNRREERRNSHRQIRDENHGSGNRSNDNHRGGSGPDGGVQKKSRREPVNLVGIIVTGPDGLLKVKPCNRNFGDRLLNIVAFGGGGAKEGDVVVVENASGHKGGQPGGGDKENTDFIKQVRIAKVIGHKDDPGLISTISLHEQGITTEFSKAAMDEAHDPVKMAIPAVGENRLDRRSTPFVTIDGPDSRDFDDAIFAEKTEDGWHMMVAIADVAWYVRPGDALDQDAYLRGNSTYFPDRAEPMFPRELSNGICSLNPGVDRAVVVRERWIDNDGNLIRKLPPYRALINSAARLTYDQIQDAYNGKPDAVLAPLMDTVVKPLYGAYESLAKARAARGTLDLDIPDRRVNINAVKGVEKIRKHDRVNSHKLVEEFMLAANEDAAASLEEMSSPCVYRIHPPPPSAERVEGLKNFARSFGLKTPDRLATREDLRDILSQAANRPFFHLIAEHMLRAQGKASYSTQNTGHYGLALERYAHFTSPIRRYADLLIHRLLITAFNLGAGGITKGELDTLQEIAAHITETEVRSDQAERSANDRYGTKYLSQHIGEVFRGQISNVTEAGLFIRLEDTGVTGLLPRRLLPRDYYEVDKKQHALIGRDTGRLFRAGANIEVKLKSADPLTSSVDFYPANDQGADIPGFISPPAGFENRDRNDRPRGPRHG